MTNQHAYIPLHELADLLAGAPTKVVRGGRAQDSLPVLSVRSLRGGRIDPSEIAETSPQVSDVARYRARPGDVIVPARSTFFTAAVLPEELDGVTISSTLIRIRCGEELHPRVLAAFLRHPNGLAAVEAISQSGAVQMNITVRGLGELLIPLPPWSEQERIAAMLEAADAAYFAAIESAELRRSLAGEVVMLAMAGADL